MSNLTKFDEFKKTNASKVSLILKYLKTNEKGNGTSKNLFDSPFYYQESSKSIINIYSYTIP